MFCLFFLKFSSQEEVYRTAFLGTRPVDFNESNYIRKFLFEKGKQNYQCYTSFPVEQPNVDNPEDYLRSKLNSSCFTFTHTNYWYFQFCPFKSLSQYRYANKGNKIDNFVLGSENFEKGNITESGMAFNWKNGDICQATKHPRQVRIEYICDQSTDEEGVLTSVSEPDFCQYIVHFHTPYACVIPNVTNETVFNVDCYTI